MSEFELDSRLSADTFPVGSYNVCKILLMNDARWPWLILVPKRIGLEEIYQAEEEDQAKILAETVKASQALKNLTGCDKINIAAIGNIVRQLHIHIVARNDDDPNWPGPVWGFGERQPYEETYTRILLNKLREELSIEPDFENRCR